MNAQYFVEKAIKYFGYILYEKDELIPGSYNFKDIQSAFQKESLRKYSWTESNDEIHIKKKSIIFPASHYLTLTIEHEGLRCKIKMKSIERAILIFF